VNPFNPCLPHRWSRTCPTSISIDEAPYAPFDATKIDAQKYYYIWF
jgi:hypothetical protein